MPLTHLDPFSTIPYYLSRKRNDFLTCNSANWCFNVDKQKRCRSLFRSRMLPACTTFFVSAFYVGTLYSHLIMWKEHVISCHLWAFSIDYAVYSSLEVYFKVSFTKYLFCDRDWRLKKWKMIREEKRPWKWKWKRLSLIQHPILSDFSWCVDFCCASLCKVVLGRRLCKVTPS